MQHKLKWFLAELIFRLHDKNQPDKHRFNKLYLPIHASSGKDAYQMVLIRASQELDNRRDYTKDYLQWEFIGIESLSQIEKVTVKSAYQYPINEPDNIPAYIHSLKKKNEAIQIHLANAG